MLASMSSSPIRLTSTTREVLDLFMAVKAQDADGGATPVWGYLICTETGLGSGTVYPILERLEEAGWITARWEADPPADRPPRRFYTLTDNGAAAYAAARHARPRRRTTFVLRRNTT